MFLLIFKTLNLRPDGSSSNSGFNGCDASLHPPLPFLTTAVLNSSPSWHCCLPTSFLALFTIKESLFSFLLRLQVAVLSSYIKLQNTFIDFHVAEWCVQSLTLDDFSHLIAISTRLDKKLPVSNFIPLFTFICLCFSHLSSSGVIMLTKCPEPSLSVSSLFNYSVQSGLK